jgi:hypothetical protein
MALRSRRPLRRLWRLCMTVALLATIVGIEVGPSPASAAPSVAAASQAVPVYCQWIPPEYWPPECRPTAPPPAAAAVEATYSARGEWPVTSTRVTVPGAPLNPVTLFYPSNLGNGGVDHPILTFAEGTGATVPDGDPFLSHFASWGYVVAGISSPGGGADVQEADSLRAAADYLVAQNGNASSTFNGKLDTGSIGVFGHSQGAGATMLVMGSSRNADGRFASAAPMALPNRAFWAPSLTPNFSLITRPIMFTWGQNDFLSGTADQQSFYDQMPGPAARATVVGADHNGMKTPSLGYLTAWFEYTLQDDQAARPAFVSMGGNPPEVSTNARWMNWAGKRLP